MSVGCLSTAEGQSCEINGKKHFSFQDIKSLLDKNKCNSCHSNQSYQSDWSYEKYEDIFKQSQCYGPIIRHGRPNESLLIDKLNGGPSSCGNAMPLANQKISDSDLLSIESWITFGAPEFCVPVYEDVKEILIKNKCGSCHTSGSEWRFDTYSGLTLKPNTSICNDQNIIKYNATESFLYKKLLANNGDICGDPMYVDGQKMSDKDVIKIRDWINAGAPESAKVLPVALNVFTTKNIENRKILISWTTASEINTSHFEIEFSIDGFNFKLIDKVLSNGANGNYTLFTTM
ncbi:MAG: hypothetical protein IPO92_02865 [Saprospiraceae bacterium]|nr:hypothetical protein [Saprospiraceae bacterium]